MDKKKLVKLDKTIKQLHELAEELGLISQGEASRIRETTRSAISQLVARKRFTVATILGQPYLFRTEVENFEKQKPGPTEGTVFAVRKTKLKD